MFDWSLAAYALPVLLGMAFLTWLASLVRRDVGIVDSVWSLFFFAALLTWWSAPDRAAACSPRGSATTPNDR